MKELRYTEEQRDRPLRELLHKAGLLQEPVTLVSALGSMSIEATCTPSLRTIHLHRAGLLTWTRGGFRPVVEPRDAALATEDLIPLTQDYGDLASKAPLPKRVPSAALAHLTAQNR